MDIQNEQALVTAKEQWTARMQEKHPGIDINDEEALYGMLLHDEEELSILQQWYDEFNDRHLTPEQREEQLRQASSSIAGECTEDALSSAVSWISAMWEKLSAGELPVEVLQMVLRGQSYDRAVAEARHAGEVAGRNSKIEEFLDDHLQSGDPCTDNNDERTCGWLSELGALNKAGRLSIWERGGERRQ